MEAGLQSPRGGAGGAGKPGSGGGAATSTSSARCTSGNGLLSLLARATLCMLRGTDALGADDARLLLDWRPN